MPKYRIVIEDTRSELLSKIFEAPSLKAAKTLAKDDTWTADDGWYVYDSKTNCEVRDDQCSQIDDDEVITNV